MKQTIFITFMVSLLLFACGPASQNKVNAPTLPFYNSVEYNPEWISPSDPNYKNIHRVGDFEFTDHHGKTFNNQSLVNKIYVADFFFTSCPSICPKLTLNMEKLQKAFFNEEEVQLISHTVMPWKDSVSVLNQYAQNMDVDYRKWKLLTGPEEEIYEMARKSYFADEQFGFTSDESDFLHTDKFILVDKQRRIRGVYSGLIEQDIQRLEEDIGILLQE